VLVKIMSVLGEQDQDAGFPKVSLGAGRKMVSGLTWQRGGAKLQLGSATKGERLRSLEV
jgi:hypothetical protein